MLRYAVLLLVVGLAACSGLSNGDVETILAESNVYPLTVQLRVYCNDQETARKAVETNLVRDGFVTAQIQRSSGNLGEPLVQFTERAKPYLLVTNDTLRSIDVQLVKIADEVFGHVKQVEVSPSGQKAVVDYTVQTINRSPFAALYTQSLEGEQKRRTFFTKSADNDTWKWDGKIIKMR